MVISHRKYFLEDRKVLEHCGTIYSTIYTVFTTAQELPGRKYLRSLTTIVWEILSHQIPLFSVTKFFYIIYYSILFILCGTSDKRVYYRMSKCKPIYMIYENGFQISVLRFTVYAFFGLDTLVVCLYMIGWDSSKKTGLK